MILNGNLKKQASDLIANGQTSKSLALLQEHADHFSEEAQSELILLQSRLAQLEKTKRLLGKDVTSERQLLHESILSFIRIYCGTSDTVSSSATRTSGNPIAEQRATRLRQKITDTYDLIEQWEEKRTLSENPTEQKRSDVEIARLRRILDQYLTELESFGDA